MISIQCDNCERVFEVPDSEAGGRKPCPSCGDVNRVPAPPAVSMAAPTAPAVSSAGSGVTREATEQEIAVIRPAMFRAHPFRYLLLLLVFGGGLALVIWGWMAEESWRWWAIGGGAVLIAIAGVWWLKWWVAATRWVKLTITNKRTIRQEGIIRRHTTEVLHDHVRSVDIQQNFVQRIFNVGSVGVDSAGQDGIEIQIDDIPTPFKVKEVIDKYRKM